MMKTINNKYYTWYNNIIERARGRTIEGYIERHHVIPRSLGGINDKINLVKLTAREHFICHLLLPKFLEGKDKQKMWRALWILSTSKKYKLNSRLFENIRKENRIITVELNKDPVNRAKKSAAKKGKTWVELYGVEGANKRKENLIKRTALLKQEGKLGYKKGVPNLKLKNKKKTPEHCKALSEAQLKRRRLLKID